MLTPNARNGFGLILAGLAGCAAARGARIHLDGAEAESFRVGATEIVIDADRGRLTLDAANVDWAAFGLRDARLRSDCMLTHREGTWTCSGTGEWSAEAGKTAVATVFDATLNADVFALEIRRDNTKLGLATDRAAPLAPLRLRIDSLPLRWFTDLLAAKLPDLALNDGRLDARLELRSGDIFTATGDYTLRDLGFDSRDGTIAGAKLGASGNISISTNSATIRLSHDGVLHGGELLLGPFYSALPERVDLDLNLTQDKTGVWRVERLALDDPGVLRVEGNARFAPFEFDLATLDTVLPLAYERYAKSLLAARGLDALETRGRLNGSLRWDRNGLAAFVVRPQNVGIADPGGRFAVEGLGGVLDWSRQSARPTTTLAWRSGELYRLVLGSARFDWRSDGGVLQLAAPASIPLFGGTIEVPHFFWRPNAVAGARVDTALAVHGVELASVTHALGWPEFGGTLGGGVPQIRYAGDRIEFSGGLALTVFGGGIDVTNLVLERPFGVAPSLAGDVALSNLDLQRLTGTFDFGEITGRLSGKIASLRLVDWAPVAFDAELRALGGGKISQRAVNSLSAVGGGGLVAGLQASMLKIFDTFGYSRIGLSCRLANNICRMSGLGSSGNGYAIVEGRGLPRISVIGHQDDVDWPTLVERLKAATSGTAPIVQ